MPNHCENILGIAGDKEDVEKFLEFVSRPVPHKGKQEVSIFDNLIPMPEELSGTNKSFMNENSSEESVSLQEKFGYDNWYDWALNNWGTKWGDYELTKSTIQTMDSSRWNSEIDSIEYRKVYYMHFYYTTAWGPGSDEIMSALAEQFPQLNAMLYYEEPGMGFAGFVVVKDGSIAHNEQWEHHQFYKDITEIDFDFYG